jgi:GTP-binding protein
MRFAFPPYGLGSRHMAAGSDEALRLVPARQFGLEQAMEFINQDEFVEVTPASIRLRKIAG